MGSHLRRAVEALGDDAGTQGSWARRFAEGAAARGTFNGATVGELSGQGSWLQQLYLALDPRPTFEGSNWIQRLGGGGGAALLAATLVEGGGGESTPPTALQLDGETLQLNGQDLVLDGV